MYCGSNLLFGYLVGSNPLCNHWKRCTKGRIFIIYLSFSVSDLEIPLLISFSCGKCCRFEIALLAEYEFTVAFHSATHSVTWLPLPPQGLFSWELACQPRQCGLEVWDVAGIWRRERRLKMSSAKMRNTQRVFYFSPRCSLRSHYLWAHLNELFCKWKYVGFYYHLSIPWMSLTFGSSEVQVMNHETLLLRSVIIMVLLPCIDFLSDEERALVHRIIFSWTMLTEHTLLYSYPPSAINNSDSGSLFCWLIWLWLYGLLFHLQGADMVGFLRLQRVSWSEWIDLCIDNSLFLSNV